MQCLSMIYVEGSDDIVHKVPCGKCAFCLQNKRHDWQFRIYHEIKAQEHPGLFLTLTYHPKYVKRTPNGFSLRFRDVQLYFKRLRKAGYKIKYIAVGEYGTSTFRPHYHILLWTNTPITELERQWWCGAIHVGRVAMASAMYTLKYIIQRKQSIPEGLEVPRAQFSRGLGISYLGRDYASAEAIYNYHNDGPNFFSYIEGAKVSLPRYYRDKIFTKHIKKIEQKKVEKQVKESELQEYARLKKKGIQDPESYILRQRIDNHNAIIRKTKHNQHL